MQTETIDSLKHQLEDRRARLRASLAAYGPENDLVRLLRQVDSALSRLDGDAYGRCLVCDERVVETDLRLIPLLEYCLCNLTQEQQRALEHDLGLARRIQSGLLPVPDLSTGSWEASYRYEPAGVVGGDYCDLWVRPGEPGAVYFAVGDVSGKGVAASLLMAHIQAAFRALLDAGTSLAELVGRINRQLLKVTLSSHYATLVCGRASADGCVEIVNAGHCPPVVARGSVVDTVGATGYPIGLIGDHTYDVAHLTLEEKDTLILYTDGLTEARRHDGEEYGQHRVESFLSSRVKGATPRSLVRALHGDMLQFAGGSTQADDLIVMALVRR